MTIAEIARIAGVTKGSVSKALNGKSGVAEDTRSRILRIAEGFDFHPDAAASSLARGRSHTLALVIPAETGPVYEGAYWASLVAAAVAATAKRGYRLQVLCPDAGATGLEAFRSALRRRAADGVIAADESLGAEVRAALAESRSNFVRIGGADGPGEYSVDVDNEGGARAMTELLIARGAARLSLLAPPERYAYAAARVAGCASALADAGLPPPRVLRCGYDAREARRAVRGLLEAEPRGALFVGAGGPLMLGALEGWRDAGGAAIGTALAVFDDSPVLELLTPPVPAVRQPIGGLAEAAVGILVELAEGRSPAAGRQVLPTELIDR
jgi:LacI family transcriptional regulator